jgi:hypothetical protein
MIEYWAMRSNFLIFQLVSIYGIARKCFNKLKIKLCAFAPSSLRLCEKKSSDAKQFFNLLINFYI